MTLLKTLVLIASIGLISSCASKKSTDEVAKKISKIEKTMDSKKMVEAGFVQGTINVSKAESCPYTIKVSSVDYLLDPINLGEDFMNNGEKIWLKYTGLRMKNRCANANPVTVVEMQKRAE